MTNLLLLLIALELLIILVHQLFPPKPTIEAATAARTSEHTPGPDLAHLTLERMVEGRWTPYAVRPRGHHDIKAIRAGQFPGVRIQGD